MKTGFKDPETPWLPQFYTNGSNGTKFNTFFYIGMGLRDFFARNSLGENGYFIGFEIFPPTLNPSCPWLVPFLKDRQHEIPQYGPLYAYCSVTIVRNSIFRWFIRVTGVTLVTLLTSYTGTRFGPPCLIGMITFNRCISLALPFFCQKEVDWHSFKDPQRICLLLIIM